MFAVRAFVQPLPEVVPEGDHGPATAVQVVALVEPHERVD